MGRRAEDVSCLARSGLGGFRARGRTGMAELVGCLLISLRAGCRITPVRDSLMDRFDGKPRISCREGLAPRSFKGIVREDVGSVRMPRDRGASACRKLPRLVVCEKESLLVQSGHRFAKSF